MGRGIGRSTVAAGTAVALALAVAADAAHEQTSNVCSVEAAPWGAVGDNATDATSAIQRCIDDCHRQHPDGAVVVLAGPGTYRITASIALASNLTLRIDPQTTLFSAVTPAMCPEGYCPDRQHPRCGTSFWTNGPTAVLCGTNLTNVAVVGAGVNSSFLDGGGWPWYYYTAHVQNGTGLRGPRLYEPMWSTNVTLAHVTLQWAAGWTVHPQFCDGVTAHDIYIHNPRAVGNTDGFDPDSCTDVVLHDTVIDTGDDGISIKSGNSTACSTCEHIQMPSKNIHIYNTKILSRNFCLGSGTFGGITDLVVEDCQIGDDQGSAPWAIKYKSHQSYAGLLKNHTYRRLRVGKIAPNSYQQPRGGYFMSIELRYHPLIPNRTCHVNTITDEGDCPIFEDVTFEDIRVTAAARAGDIAGFKGDLLRGLTFRNVTFDTAPPTGWSCGYVDLDSFTAENVVPPINCSKGPASGAPPQRGRDTDGWV